MTVELKYPTAAQLDELFRAGPVPRLRELNIAKALISGDSTVTISHQHPGLTDSAVLFVVRGTLRQLSRYLLPEELQVDMCRQRAQTFSREPFRTYWLPVLNQVIRRIEDESTHHHRLSRSQA